MLKRAGRGQDLSGISGTKQGELVQNAQLVPIQGRTYLMDGSSMSRHRKFRSLVFLHISNEVYRYLYNMYLAVDANFKLKGKSRGISDIELMPGWGLFVEEEPYQCYLENYVDQPEVKHALTTTLWMLMHAS